MADRTVKVTLTLNAAQYRNALQQAGAETQTLAQRTDKAALSTKSLFRAASISTAAFGFTRLIEGAVSLEAAYSKAMAQVAVATGAPKSELDSLDKLALKLGRDTVFSAQDAASAMLELAKGGLTSAQIKAGALADTLTLASAGGLDLATAAGTVVNAMGAFRLGADQTSGAVAALAGAANASSSDVSDVALALSQVGTTAHSAGLSIQQTTAYIALLSNEGIKGSDAGTALRTMFTRLVPQTKQAKAAMAELNLTYLDHNNNLVSAEEIARRTQKAFKGLSDGDKIRATNAIFGTDAQRAVNAITAEGVGGLQKYEKATNDLTQAQKLAKAANSGTAGAIENLKGSIETAEIKIGKGLAPTVQSLATDLNDLVAGGDVETWAANAGAGFEDFLHEIAPLVKSVGGLAQSTLPALNTALTGTVDVLELGAKVLTPFVDAFNKLPDSAQKALVLAAGAKVLSSRLSGIPGLAGPAGNGLLMFGGSASKAGEQVEGAGQKAKTAGTRFGGFAATLKANGLLAGATFALGDLADQTDTFTRSLHAADGATKNISKTFSRDGAVTAATVRSIEASFKDSNVGKYASDLGINLDKLSEDFARNGEKGAYFQEVLKNLQDHYKTFGNALTDISPLDFGGTKGDHMEAALRDLEKFVGVLDDAGDKANVTGRKFNQTRNNIMLAFAGIDKYRDKLSELPTAVVTAITTPGALKSKEDVVSLARLYNLTPDQVETIMKAKDFATKDIKSVLKYLAITDGTTANPHVKLTGVEAAKAALRALTKLINNLPGVHIRTPSRPGNPTIEHWAGGRIGPPLAGGGRVPGTPPSNPFEDNVLAMTPWGAQSLRSREWVINQEASDKNDKWLDAINRGADMNKIMASREVAGTPYRPSAAESASYLGTQAGGITTDDVIHIMENTLFEATSDNRFLKAKIKRAR